MLFSIRLISIEAIRAWDCLDADSGDDRAQKMRDYYVGDFSDWKDRDAFEAAFARLMEGPKAEGSSGWLNL